MQSTRIKRHIKAPRPTVYRALLTSDMVEQWMVPEGMTIQIHEFDGREGGRFRVSLTYTMTRRTGKTSQNADTYHGRFVKLVPNEMVVEAVEFETEDPRLQGEMAVILTLMDADGGTNLVAVHENLPPGLSPADNEVGWQMALSKLAALAEGR